LATVLVGTRDGIRVLDSAGVEQDRVFEGRAVDDLTPASWKWLWAIVDGEEIWRQAGSGWVMVAHLRDLPGAEDLVATCLADTRANAEAGILVGTSRARLLRVNAAGALEVVDSFDEAPGRDEWFTPWGGPPDTRSVTENHDNVFVNVHVGGVLRTRDEGASWEQTIDIGADIHRVVTGHRRVYAAGAHGVSVSDDDGDTWRLSHEGLHARYCRGVAVCGETVLVSASTGPGGGRAAVYRAGVDADAFTRCGAGLPEWFAGNIDSLCLDALPGGELAAFASEDGELYTSVDRGATWTLAASGLPPVSAVLTLP